MRGGVLKKAVVSVLMVAAVIWTVRYGMIYHSVENRNYSLERAEPGGGLAGFAAVHYHLGLRAWYENRPRDAREAFFRAVDINALFVDAWLKLAEVYQADGDLAGARQVLVFTDQLAGDVVKWKWEHVLLARQLGMEEMFLANVNFVISFWQLRDQALTLIDWHFNRNTQAVLTALADQNLADYLRWLIRQDRVADSLKTWEKLIAKSDIDPSVYHRYIAFLIRHGEIEAAVRIRKEYTDLDDELVNPGFEQAVSNTVFGWSIRSGEAWDVGRDQWDMHGDVHEGNYALQIRFDGSENVNFYHVRQVVPVEPGKTYSLSFWWKGRNLTTDKRPFLEIVGRGCSGRWKSSMAAPDFRWKKEQIRFTAGTDCHAVMIRIRRTKSFRFDNKINGRLWVDSFALVPTDDDHRFSSDN